MQVNVLNLVILRPLQGLDDTTQSTCSKITLCTIYILHSIVKHIDLASFINNSIQDEELCRSGYEWRTNPKAITSDIHWS